MVLFSKNSSFRKVAAIASILLAFSLSCTNAFVLPNAFANTRCAHNGAIALPNHPSRQRHPSTPLNAIPLVDGTIHDALSPTIVVATSTILLSDGLNSSLEILKNLLVAIGSTVVGFAALTFVTINFVVPKAAEQLESDTKRLKPDLWEEYQAKLEEGETMAMRPDLLQEGQIMKPYVMASYDSSATAKRSNDAGESSSEVDASDGSSEKPNIMGDGGNQWRD
mmetsp:Transcript_28275/g.33478  ORF Transcript_28275/g.33478 Transcript_28275/m.33478 type:complete len:223 (+) Transcript_28275:176-844(+)